MLVSVIVITYNSSQYVLDTLESVRLQTYTDIELIVSDDCSADDTFAVCNQWVEEHKERFVNVKVIHTPSNGGICKNYNYSLRHAQGKWIKYIAGDDTLEPNCIERFVSNIQPNTFLYTCVTNHWNTESGKSECYKTRIPDTTAWRQARFMLKYLYGINGPTIFVEREHLLQVGGFEERYPMIEDWPIAIRFATNGWRIGIVDEKLVNWRIYGESISHSNHSFSVSLRNAFRDYTMRYCWRYLLPFHHYHHWLNFRISDMSQRNDSTKIINYLLRCLDVVNFKRKLFPIPQEPYKKYDS